MWWPRLDLTGEDLDLRPCKRRVYQWTAKKIEKPFQVVTEVGTLLGNPGDYVVSDEYGKRTVYKESDFDNFFEFIEEEE